MLLASTVPIRAVQYHMCSEGANRIFPLQYSVAILPLTSCSGLALIATRTSWALLCNFVVLRLFEWVCIQTLVCRRDEVIRIRVCKSSA